MIFDGVDAGVVRPGDVQQLKVGDHNLTLEDEIVTYATRNFEPYRGFETFIKAMEIVQRQRSRAHILVVGETGGKGYGFAEAGEDYLKHVLDNASLVNHACISWGH